MTRSDHAHPTALGNHNRGDARFLARGETGCPQVSIQRVGTVDELWEPHPTARLRLHNRIQPVPLNEGVKRRRILTDDADNNPGALTTQATTLIVNGEFSSLHLVTTNVVNKQFANREYHCHIRQTESQNAGSKNEQIRLIANKVRGKHRTRRVTCTAVPELRTFLDTESANVRHIHGHQRRWIGRSTIHIFTSKRARLRLRLNPHS